MDEVIAKELSKSYNIVREAFHKELYSVDELKELFRGEGCPFGSNYVKPYVDAGMLIRVSRGKYQLPEKPVIYTVVGKTISSVRSALCESQRKRNVVVPKPIKEELKINEYIEFLKSKGYRVYAPTTTWNEI